MVEYVFYIYFMLALLNIVSVFTAEQMRIQKRFEAALKIESTMRIVYLTTFALTILATLLLYLSR